MSAIIRPYWFTGTCVCVSVTLGYLDSSVFSAFVCRFFVKAGTPSFMVFAKDSPFKTQFLTGKKVKRL